MKPYPCCRHTHPAVDAALELRDSLGRGSDGEFTPDRIASVEILTYPAALEVTDRPRPTTPYAAQFSMQYCVARSLACGPPDLASFEPSKLGNENLGEWMSKTTVEADARFEAAYPSHWGAGGRDDRHRRLYAPGFSSPTRWETRNSPSTMTRWIERRSDFWTTAVSRARRRVIC